MHSRLRKIVRQLVEIGDLSWMLDDHQEKYIYNHFREWQTRRHKDPGANRLFMVDAARQTGKTHASCLILSEDNIREPRSRALYGSATAVGLAEFVIPNLEFIYDQFPEDLKPKYTGRYKGQRAMYRFPNGSQLKLVGIDDDPDGLRGPKLHRWVLGEAAFIKKLRMVVGSVLYEQMQRVPNSWGMFESSAPRDIDHDFDMVFRPSCEARNAYVFMTIDDNTAISDETKKEFVDAAREIDPEDAEREYYGKRPRNKKTTVFPEYDAERMKLKHYELPKFGLALHSIDPGQTHFFAMSWSVYDYLEERVVYIDDWAEHNPNTETVAAITAAREYDLFGTHPPSELARLDVAQWEDLLGDDRTACHAEVLHELAQEGKEHSEFRWYDNDGKLWRYNPCLRVSDINLQLINDLSTIYGIHVTPTTKDDLRRVMCMLVRSMMKQNRIFFGPGATQTAAHVNAATWDKLRKKWAEHSVFSHYDLAATVVYGERYWVDYHHIDPYPPKHLGRGGPDWIGEYKHEEQSYGDFW